MIYAKYLTVPALTSSAAPAEVELPIAPGMVKSLDLVFPDGCVGLVGVRVMYREYVLWPSNPDEWFYGNDTHYSQVENLKLADLPHVLRLQGYSEDDVYSHNIYFVLSVVRDEPDLLSALLATRPTLAVLEG